MRVNVTSNISVLSKAIDAFGKNQMPFATSLALNDTAFAVRSHIVTTTYPQSFEVKSRGFARAMFRVGKANKRKLSASVYDRFEKDYMTNQAEGGIKSKRGRYTAIPAADRPPVRSRATYDRHKPRTVLSRPRAFKQTVNGQDMILERRTKKRYPLKRLYLLEEGQINIPKRFPFYEDGTKMARSAFQRSFGKRFAQAKRTARR